MVVSIADWSRSRKMARPAVNPSELGRLLRDLRIGAGLTTRALGAQAGVDPSLISYVEHGRRRPSRRVIRRLWLGLNGEADDLDRLLAAAGLLPESIVEAGGWDAYLRLWRGQVATLERKLELRIEHSGRQINELLNLLEERR